MPRITKVYTRTGDDGTTALAGGVRVPKDARRVACYGTVDETNSAIGVAVASGVDPHLAAMLARIQNELFHLGAELCVPPATSSAKRSTGPRVEARHVRALEKDIDSLQSDLAPLANFVLPGGAIAAAQLQVARTVCRRAERLVVALARKEEVAPEAVRYLNRLSDLLFVMARWENRAKGAAEPLWDSRA